MKKILANALIVFLASVLSLHAQEREKIHVKIIKEENGKIVEIDTLFEGTEHGGMHFYGDVLGEINVDSILTELKFEDHKGMKYITVSDEFQTNDTVKHIWHTINTEVEGDSVMVRKHVYFSKGGNKKLIEVFVTEDGDHSKVRIESIGDDTEHTEGNVTIYKYKADDGKRIIKAEIQDDKEYKKEKSAQEEITKGDKKKSRKKQKRK